MEFFRLTFILGLFTCLNAFSHFSLSSHHRTLSQESDPESFIKNVSVIHGNYIDTEIDAVIQGPDPLVIARFYNSQDQISETNLGGWRLFPHCYLFMQKDPLKGEYITAEGKYENTYLFVGTETGDILTYKAWHNTTQSKSRTLFELDPEKSDGLANTARGEMTAWTNQKNNKAYYLSESQAVEFFPSYGGKRIYVKSHREGCFCLQHEVLPSGNRVFYHYDDQDRLLLIEMKNSTEKKTISWIKFAYGSGIEITTSDLKSVSYRFMKYDSEHVLLAEVIRSQKPTITYQYDIIDNRALLNKKDFPGGRYVKIDYEKETNKVSTILQPLDDNQLISTVFSYNNSEEDGYTEVKGPENRQNIYRFNAQSQLIAREDYLSGSLYRTHRKSWSTEEHFGNLKSISIETAGRDVLYYKSYQYNEKGGLLEEKEYGNLTGAHVGPVLLNEEGVPSPDQESHVKSYSYSDKQQFHLVQLKDIKGDSLHFLYKPGTNILLGKVVMEKDRWGASEIKKREFFEYNEDGALILAITDDGVKYDSKSTDYVTERHLTIISPKLELPNLGAPEVIEDKCLNKGAEVLVKKVVNHFDEKGYVRVQDIFDSEGKHCYSLKKDYENGLISCETDPEGHEITYAYNVHHNLELESHLSKGITYKYDYDLSNHRIRTTQLGNQGECFETSFRYDGNENLISTIDKTSHETLYQYDDLGRLISASYPPVSMEDKMLVRPVYTYDYDLFDHAILITDPQQRITCKSFNVRGQPTLIQYPDGTEELFKYDTEGSLHRHRDRDGTTRVFEYDYQGRVNHIQRYPRGSKPDESRGTNTFREYNAFHLQWEQNENGHKTQYIYDQAGRLKTRSKGMEKTDFQYDPLGRVYALKRWKTDSTYVVEVKEYNFLNQLLEERLEDHQGAVLLKKKFTYDPTGQLKQIIGYPNNQENILAQYGYDGIGRIVEITDGLGLKTQISYQDNYIDSLGQKVLRRTTIDSMGNEQEELIDVFSNLTLVSTKNKKGELLYQKEIIKDAVGNKILEKYARIPQEDNPKDFTLRYKHEKGDLLTSITQAEGSPQEMTAIFKYNAYGDMESLYLPKNKEPISYKYHGLGYLRSLTFKKQNATEPTVYEFEYNRLGDIKEIELSQHALSYDYDDNDRLVSEEIKDMTKNKSYKISWTYDQEGAITSIKLPDGSFIDYAYRGPLVIEIARRSKEKEELYKHRLVSYDLMGNILEEILPFHGGSRKQLWDNTGRRTAILTDFFQDKVLENGYDLLSRVKQREITAGSSKTLALYDYNELSQLTSEKGVFDNNYTYDSLDNRLTKDGEIYKNNALNQLREASGRSYEFDLNGNLASQKSNNAEFIYDYNPLNQLSVIKDSKGNTISFTYDAQGKRLTKKVEFKDKGVKEFRYFYLGETELGCLDETGSIVELRIPLNPNQPEKSTYCAFEFKKTLYVPIYDLQGNVACLINPKQRKIVETYNYSTFGEERILNDKGISLIASSVGNPWRFFGKRIDQETGLIYFGHRYYNPSIGRWISPDPLGTMDGPNLYAFVHNNPLSWTDYFGLAAEVNASQNEEFLTYFKGELEPQCVCERHRTCKRGGDIINAIGGASLGSIKFGFSALRGLVDQYGAMAMGDFLEDFPIAQRERIVEAVDNWRKKGEEISQDFIIDSIDFDSSSRISQNFQTVTYYGLLAVNVLRPNFKNPKRFFSSVNHTLIETELRYTKSNLKLGQQMHKAYKTDQVVLREKIKEYILPSRKKIDFLDIVNGKIYELKPNNPRSIKLGHKQLQEYMEELKTIPRFKDINWEPILETY